MSEAHPEWLKVRRGICARCNGEMRPGIECPYKRRRRCALKRPEKICPADPQKWRPALSESNGPAIIPEQPEETKA